MIRCIPCAAVLACAAMTQAIIANWKMHSPNLADWAANISPAALASEAEIVLCPPFTQLLAAQMLCERAGLALGAQDCHAENEGAFTGDISAEMLQRSGCRYVIVGHSERRAHHGETDAMVAAKAERALAHELTPIICIGESLQEYEAGETLKVLERQIKQSVPGSAQRGQEAEPSVREALRLTAEASRPEQEQNIILAYEPIWAIGSGKTPDNEAIGAAHAHIKKHLERALPVVYGGSVKPGNAAEILALEGVDGVLVGSASLKPEDFAAIINAAH